jgi:hypothetical protein
MVDDDDHAPRDSSDGPPIAYSPTIAVPVDDPLLARLNEIHGRDLRRHADDLTSALAKAASSHVREE